MIAVVAAYRQEAESLLARLGPARRVLGSRPPVYLGRLSDHAVAVMICGQGRSCAVEAVVELDRLYSPRLFISTGFAGALGPHCSACDVVMATEVCDSENGRCIVVEDSMSDVLPDDPSQQYATYPGLVVTAGSIAGREEKLDLSSRFPGALSVDMESFHVVSTAADLGRKAAVVRAIVDDSEWDISWMRDLVGSSGRTNVRRFVQTMSLRPVRFADLARLYRIGRRASAHLADRIAAVVCNPAEERDCAV